MRTIEKTIKFFMKRLSLLAFVVHCKLKLFSAHIDGGKSDSSEI